MYLSKQLLLTSSIVLLTIASFAQSAETMDTTAIEVLEDVEVQSKKSHRNPSTLHQTSLSKEALLSSQSNTFVNTLEKLPGISAIQTGVGISKPVIRGLSLNRVIVNEYGVKQEGQQWGMDHGLEIDPFNVDRVDIIKGPVSLLYGSDGIGGVINILAPTTPYNEQLKGEIITTYKSNNNLLGFNGKLKQRIGDYYYIANMSYQNYSVYKVPADSFIYNNYRLPIYDGYLKNTGGNELNASILLGVEKDWGKSSLYISNFHQKAGFFPGAFGVPRSYQLQPADNPRKVANPSQLINHFKIIQNNQFYSQFGTFLLDIGYQYNNRQEKAAPHGHGGITPSGTTALALQLQTFSVQLKHTKQLLHTKIQSGISSQYQNNKVTGYEFLIPNYQQIQIGAFSYLEYQWRPEWLLTGGLRYDYAFQKAAEGLLSFEDKSGVHYESTQSPSLQKQYHNISTGLGIQYQISNQWNALFNIGSAFRIPIVAELLANGIHHGTFRHEMGNASLESERGILTDFNLDYTNKRFKISVSPFINYFSNYIYLKPSGRFSPLPEAGQIYQYVGNRTLFMGSEMTVDMAITPEWDINTAIEYVWNENRDAKMPLPFTPPFSILNELQYKPLFLNKTNKSAHSLQMNGQYFAAQNRTDINEPTTPGYYLINAGIQAKYPIKNQHISIYFQLRNLLNQKYMNNMSRYRILNLPEQGLNVQLMLRYEF